MRVLFLVDLFSIIEPMGVMQLSAIVKARGHETSICTIEEQDIFKAIVQFKPQVLACSFMTTEALRFKGLLEEVRRRYPSLILVAGGPHPTYYPQIMDTWPLDALVVGEGDRVFSDLLENLCAGKSLRSLMNVHTKEFKNAQGDLVSDLDELPFVDRGLVGQREPFKFIPMKSFFATRGCPYNCAYCFNSAFNAMHQGKGSIVRRRSVENLILEIEQVKAHYQLDFLRFGDDTFVMKYDAWVEEFVEQYRRRIKVPFYCLMNPNLAEERLIKALKEAGCYSIMMGIESGNEVVRRRVLGRSVTDRSIKEAFRLYHKYDIKVFSNTILALPETGLKEDLESLDFTLDCHPCYAGFTVYTPFPGTALGEYVKEKGYVKADDPLGASFPISLQSGSVLNTVTDRERDIHRNILVLAPVANMFRSVRNLISKRLIYWKPNFIFDLVGFCVRNYCNWKTFPFSLGPIGFLYLLKKVVGIDKNNYRTRLK
jgi:radical SAM superfamily enzyme YgiQ (UPF0313 family)